MADSFDVVVIGGGPAGYPAAIRAGQNKLSVACIDEWKNHDGSATFGGTCLNAGCIPSKALLESSELYHRAREEFATHGIKTSGVSLDLVQMQKRKSGIVKTMTQGILALLKGAGATALQGHGKLLPGKKVEFTAHDGTRRELTAKNIILASGSAPIELKSAPFDASRTAAVARTWSEVTRICSQSAANRRIAVSAVAIASGSSRPRVATPRPSPHNSFSLNNGVVARLMCS